METILIIITIMQSLRDVFIQNLKFNRKRKGITQEKLSELINMSPSYINAIETKSSFPQPEVIEKIAQVLSIPPYELFKYDGCPQNTMQFDSQKFAKEISDLLYKKLQADIYKNVQEVIQNY